MPDDARMSGSESGAQAGAGIVLLTLAAGQFLMTLDTSVMNVAVATVAEDVGMDVTGDPDGDHLVYARDGDPDEHGREDRRPDRPQAGVRISAALI
jgi:hypothetical protein